MIFCSFGASRSCFHPRHHVAALLVLCEGKALPFLINRSGLRPLSALCGK